MLSCDDLHGRLVAAVPVPFAADGTIHRDAQRRYARHVAGLDRVDVAVWAHTGRGLALDEAQRAEVLTSWREALGPGRLVVAAAGAPRGLRDPGEVLDAARGIARQAAALGADALLVHPPTAFRGRPDGDRMMLEYHAAVAEAGLPLIAFYLYEAAGGVSYPPHVLAQILARPEVLGIKVATLDSVMTYQQVARLVLDDFPGKILLTGEDRFLGYSLMAGASAALIGMGAARTRLQRAFLDAYLDGDAARFLTLNDPIDRLAIQTFRPPMEGYIRRMLWCLVHEGVIPPEAAHDPWGPTPGRGEFEALGKALEAVPLEV